MQTNNMKNIHKICIFILLFSTMFYSPSFDTLFYADNLPYFEEQKLTIFDGEIPHFFTHEIIANPDIAFDDCNKLSRHFDKDCITYNEFQKFLQSMYENNFMLVDIYDLIDTTKETPTIKKLYFPSGKKPMLLSFDDMSYDTKNTGLCDKIILTNDGKIASYTKKSSPQIQYNRDSLPILEQFIALHPDFSFNNARAVICPTGYNGILGYQINKSNKNYAEEIKKIKPLISKLKALNYHFGCHTYNHISVKYSSDLVLREDLKKYNDEIFDVIGNTDIFCFPCGARTSTMDKLSIMKNYGYKIFLCVGLVPPIQEKENCIFLDRKVLDGHSLRNYRQDYKHFFD